MYERSISLLSHTLLFIVLSIVLVNPVFAKSEKFIYVYNSSGELLQPLNAALKCPDPSGGSGAARVSR
jgi:hypothetical protein